MGDVFFPSFSTQFLYLKIFLSIIQSYNLFGIGGERESEVFHRVKYTLSVWFSGKKKKRVIIENDFTSDARAAGNKFN